MDERELKLNSLSRYSKSSAMYVLEEYGHCEVPAGCGGVVLRWRNPRNGIPLRIWLYTNGEGKMYLDGGPPPSGIPVVSFGEHVLAFELPVADPAYTVLNFAAFFPPELPRPRVTGPDEPSVSIVSAADGTWKYTVQEPGDGWKSSGFDDSTWSPMVANDVLQPPNDPRRNMGEYRFAAAQRHGGAGLGVPEPATRVWIRKTFEVTGDDDV
ncbi:hypothetical protein BZB76_1349 [Actinomadura pelletieri DSM 43383]|uniref:Uncharacterized protein n=1 Tax=Actinomadura pelletieri DSM 43383 TaxID=1120940 RepID=A0A495R0C6_9ACTN|nr:hypothetical protein [Actinomadura pelletieri]RKS79870.1 hypothetical protein BZB76_1349 [Actinomadura pelletieri DSM 43383]